MKAKSFSIVGLLLLSISAKAEPKLEPLYGDYFNKKGIVIQVYSGGCTYKNSFEIRKVSARGVQQIAFYRIKPDFCESYYKYGKQIGFTYEELGLQSQDRFKVVNPRLAPRVNW